MIKNFKRKKGFTLIELIIVIAIIGVLSAIAVPKYIGIQNDAKVNADIASAKVIVDATNMRIGEEKIILPTSVDITVLLGGTNTGDANTVNTAITGYLQSVPTPKATSAENFTVVIDSDGVVSATATATATTTGI